MGVMNSMNGKKIAIIVCLLLIGGVIGFFLGKTSHNIETNDTKNQHEESGTQDEKLDQDTTNEEIHQGSVDKQDPSLKEDLVEETDKISEDTTQEHVDNVSNDKQESSLEKDSEERNATSQQEEKKDKYELPEF